jgi:hypothetical protein
VKVPQRFVLITRKSWRKESEVVEDVMVPRGLLLLQQNRNPGQNKKKNHNVHFNLR